jgi:spoIIIJ-associated protein
MIVAQIISKEVGEPIMVLVDVNEYRKRRNDYLKSLAQRAVQEAKDNNQDVELPPLSAFERRVIHIALKGENGVTTESVGEGEERHIVIKISAKGAVPDGRQGSASG